MSYCNLGFRMSDLDGESERLHRWIGVISIDISLSYTSDAKHGVTELYLSST